MCEVYARRAGCVRDSTPGGDRPARDECRRPSLSPRRTADRTGATTKTRRGGEAGRRNAEPPIRTGRPDAVASGCRKETAASPCGARPGGASSEARHRERAGRTWQLLPGTAKGEPAGRAIRVSTRPSLRRMAGRSFLRGEAPRRDGQTWQLRPGTAKGAAGGEGDKSFGEAVLAARSRAELPPRRDPEKGRAESTNTVRNRTG